MTLEDLRQIPLLQTRSIAEACGRDPRTKQYIFECLDRYFRGDYGEVPEEDFRYNNEDLEGGEGHILARYKPKFALDSDIYIETHFSISMPGNIDANNTMIMYCNERKEMKK